MVGPYFKQVVNPVPEYVLLKRFAQSEVFMIHGHGNQPFCTCTVSVADTEDLSTSSQEAGSAKNC